MDAGGLGADKELVRAHRSEEVLRATGKWLAEKAFPERFIWVRSRNSIEHHVGGRRESIVLRSSYRNRPGKDIRIWVEALEVRDEALRMWRRRHPDLTLERPRNVDDLVCVNSYLDLAKQLEEYELNLTSGDERPARLAVLAGHLQRIALSWFRATAESASLANQAWNDMIFDSAPELMEYAYSKGHVEQAQAILERILELRITREQLNKGRILARHGTKPPWKSPYAVGWTAEKLELFGR